MRQLFSIAIVALLAGCLEMEQTIRLAADGSGGQVLRLDVRESTLADAQRASSATALGAAANPSALFDKELVGRELAATGMVLVRHEAKKLAGSRRVELEATFATFAGLQQSPLCGSAAEWVLARGPKEGTAKLTLYLQGRAAWLEARAKAERMRGEVDAVAADFFRRRMEQTAGLDVKLRLEVPGDVLVWTKNMTKTGPREVTVHVTAATVRTPEDLVRWLAPRFELIFDASGCSLPLD